MQIEYFKTQEEVLRYILAGGMVSSDDYGGPVIKLIDGKISLVPMPHYRNLMQRAFTFGNPSVWKPYKEPHWTDKLSKGKILCKVWGDSSNPNYVRLALVTRVKSNGIFVDENFHEWKNATPCTSEEIAPLLYDIN